MQGLANYLPMQNFEKILSKTSSLSTLPTISPRLSRALRRSLAVISAGARILEFSSAWLINSAAFERAEAWRADTRISSAEAVMWNFFISSITALFNSSIPSRLRHETLHRQNPWNFFSISDVCPAASHLFRTIIELFGESLQAPSRDSADVGQIDGVVAKGGALSDKIARGARYVAYYRAFVA